MIIGDVIFPQILTGSYQAVSGCNDISACNYNEDATEDDGSCTYPQENYDCNGICIAETDDGCECGILQDICGICDGTGIEDGYCDCYDNIDLGCGCGQSGPSGCDNVCDSILEFDECGVCGGSGIGEEYCDCDENTLDCTGSCGGEAISDECGICLGDNLCLGCIDQLALNYNPEATINNENCVYNPATEFTATYNDADEIVLLIWQSPETGPEGPCPNEGEVLDCNGNCGPESWIGDGSCDDGSYYYSITYGYCGTDPFTLPAEDCISISFDCDEFTDEIDDCSGNGCPQDYIMDCFGICAPYSWIGDGYCDVGQWGAFLYCETGSWDGGDCGSCSDLNNVQDCNGDCWPYNVIGDGWCDEDGYINWDPFNFEEDFDCSAFG
jgi:hypothetical protein